VTAWAQPFADPLEDPGVARRQDAGATGRQRREGGELRHEEKRKKVR